MLYFYEDFCRISILLLEVEDKLLLLFSFFIRILYHSPICFLDCFSDQLFFSFLTLNPSCSSVKVFAFIIVYMNY